MIHHATPHFQPDFRVLRYISFIGFAGWSVHLHMIARPETVAGDVNVPL
jgi:hypothetical protein